MATTTFTGPVVSTNGFTGAVTGAVTGNVTGNVTGDLAGNVTGNVTGNITGVVTGTRQALSGAGAVNLTTDTTELTTTGGAQALTLANGTAGQKKSVIHKVDGGSAVLTPTSALGFTTITFTNAGESVTLEYTSAGWAIIALYGAVAA